MPRHTVSPHVLAPEFGFASWSGPLRKMLQPHGHQEVEINYLTSGSVTYLIGGKLDRVRAHRLTAFWAAVPHQVVAAEEPAQLFWFTIPFAWFLQWHLPENFLRRLLRGEMIADRRGNLANESSCTRWHTDLAGANPLARRAAALEIEALMLRLAGDQPNARPKANSIPSGSLAAIQRIAAHISLHYAGKLSVAEMTKPSGLHPNYAMALFRKTCGMTVVEYLLHHRLFHARRLLATTNSKVLDVALESGFGSASRFYEAFVKACGCSPKKFRLTTQRAGNQG